jgi:hypothetical protein
MDSKVNNNQPLRLHIGYSADALGTP